MTYQQPLNNIVRGTLMGLAAVLGGVQSLGVSGYDEAISIPSEHAHQMSVRIQQILQHETNITAVADPLGGSFYLERLTADLEERGWAFFDEIEQQGGFIAALDSGWLHRKAAENQLAHERALGDGSRTTVGVNQFTEDCSPFEVGGFLPIEGVWEQSIQRLHNLRVSRDERAAAQALRALDQTCRGEANIMPAMLDAVAADVTLGEIGDVFRERFGDWQVPIHF
jgi:methylmalonyl-CoA mutase N-terminal domain/subunit